LPISWSTPSSTWLSSKVTTGKRTIPLNPEGHSSLMSATTVAVVFVLNVCPSKPTNNSADEFRYALVHAITACCAPGSLASESFSTELGFVLFAASWRIPTSLCVPRLSTRLSNSTVGVREAHVTPPTSAVVKFPASSVTRTSTLKGALPGHVTGIPTPSTPESTPSSTARPQNGPAAPVQTHTLSAVVPK